jgi:CheY-like chemotaxis protein
VRAAAGQGSVFVVELPAPRGDADADPDVAPRAGRAVHVLVVDDDASARLVARRGLERLGVVVTVVDDAGAALAALEHAHAAGSPFELVLLDQRLGDDDRTDGVAVATGWRDRERALGARRVPIVAVTGDASDIAAARCRAAAWTPTSSSPFPSRRSAGSSTRCATRTTRSTPPATRVRPPRRRTTARRRSSPSRRSSGCCASARTPRSPPRSWTPGPPTPSAARC